MQLKKPILAVVFVSAFLFFASSAFAVPQFSGETQNVSTGANYVHLAGYQFNITMSVPVSYVLLEHNFTVGAATANTSNITTNQSLEYYTELADIPANSVYRYRWFANDTANGWNVSSYFNFTVVKSNTTVQLWLNGTEGNRWYENATVINITAKVNSSDAFVSISTNFTGWPSLRATGTNKNTSLIAEQHVMDVNITGYVNNTDNANYTTSSVTYYAKLTAPYYEAYNINDSYINFNQSVNITATINHSFAISEAIIEINASHIQVNLTLGATGTNYTVGITKANALNDTQSNVTTVQLFKLYVLDTLSNASTNLTGLSFDYANTTIAYNSDPEPVGSTETAVDIWVHYNQTDGTLVQYNCTITLFDTLQLTSYQQDRLQTTFNPTGKATGTYTYTVNCTNSSYQTQNRQSIITISGGGAGGDGGTGGPVGTTTTTVPGVLGIIACGNGICEVGETWLNCWADCPLISLPTPSAPGVTTTTLPVGGPVEITPEQTETIVLIAVLIIVGLAVTKFLRFW